MFQAEKIWQCKKKPVIRSARVLVFFFVLVFIGDDNSQRTRLLRLLLRLGR